MNEDPEAGGYDPNRDWGWNWQPDYVQRGAYLYPFSLPETRAVRDFALNHPNIAGVITHHNTGGMLLRGPGSADDAKYYHSRLRLPGVAQRPLYRLWRPDRLVPHEKRGIYLYFRNVFPLLPFQ
ncbi:MAG: M14 family zinc carboxypeptidase [Bacteroidales bacterium]